MLFLFLFFLKKKKTQKKKNQEGMFLLYNIALDKVGFLFFN